MRLTEVREHLKGETLSFADIAKIVGERWQVLSPDEREKCDRRAAEAKERYYHLLSEYKKTPQYAQYQVYLAEFKAKHAAQGGGGWFIPGAKRKRNGSSVLEGKRSRLETELSAPASDRATVERSTRSQVRLGESSGSSTNHYRSISTENVDAMTPSGPYLTSASASPAARQFNNPINSPQIREGPSPVSASPHSISAFRDPGTSASAYPPPDPRDRRHDPSPTTMPSAAFLPPAASPPAVPLPPYQNVHDPPVRRQIIQETARERPPVLKRSDSSVPSVPSLAHTDTTASSVSEDRSRQSSYVGVVPPPPTLPPLDQTKSLRILPQPVPSIVHSPTDVQMNTGLPTRSVPIGGPTTTGQDPRHGWSALLMATDIARGEEDRGPIPEDKPP